MVRLVLQPDAALPGPDGGNGSLPATIQLRWTAEVGKAGPELVLNQPQNHAGPGRHEGILPGDVLTQVPAEERSNEAAD